MYCATNWLYYFTTNWLREKHSVFKPKWLLLNGALLKEAFLLLRLDYVWISFRSIHDVKATEMGKFPAVMKCFLKRKRKKKLFNHFEPSLSRSRRSSFQGWGKFWWTRNYSLSSQQSWYGTVIRGKRGAQWVSTCIGMFILRNSVEQWGKISSYTIKLNQVTAAPWHR